MYPLVDITKGALGSSLWNVSLNVPLWMPTALCGGLATWGGLAARKIKNRRERGLCLFCGYDRGGLAGPSTPCPECGNIVKP
jgi:hypothetical protein